MTEDGPRRPWAAAAAIYAGLTLLNTWPILLALGSALPNDTIDPGLNAWILWWNAHAMPFTARWWNAPAFFPAHGVLALSETFLGLLPVTTPLQWLGTGPVAAHNVCYVLSFPAAAFAADALARRLTGRVDAGLLAGIAFGFGPYRAAQMPHLQLLVTWWMPLGLLGLHRFLETRRRRDLALVGVSWFFNGLATGYYLFFFAVLVALWLLWFVRARRDWIAILFTLAMASLPLAPLLVGYAGYQRAFGLSRGIAEAEWYGADLTAFWSASPYVWFARHWTFTPRPEGELYLGTVLIAVVGVGAWRGWRALARRPSVPARRIFAIAGLVVSAAAVAAWLSGGPSFRLLGITISMSRPFKTVTVAVWLFAAAACCDRRLADLWRRRSVFAFYGLAAVVLAVLALGPVGRVFELRFMYRAPYSWLMMLPGGHSLRVPARFAMLVALCLAVAVAMAFTRLTRRGARPLAVALVAAGLALDGWVPLMRAVPVSPGFALAGVEPEAAVLELPMSGIVGDSDAMLHATTHGHPVVNGYSGYEPPHYAGVDGGLRVHDPSVIATLRGFGPLVVVVVHARDAGGIEESFVRSLPGAREVSRLPIGPVFSLPAVAMPVPPREGPPVAMASADASTGQDAAGAVFDGKLDSVWSTVHPQMPGDELRVTLAAPAVVSRVELDLGDYASNFPRQLRIAALDDAGVPTVVWEGGTGGAEITGAFADRARLPVVLDLSRAVRATRLVLTETASDPHAEWIVAELRLFGPAQ